MEKRDRASIIFDLPTLGHPIKRLILLQLINSQDLMDLKLAM
jgi:hypothetical protein